MALDSHSVRSPSCSTGTFPLGFNTKCSGLRCSPCSNLSSAISCASPSSLSAKRTFCGLINHAQYSFIVFSSYPMLLSPGRVCVLRHPLLEFRSLLQLEKLWCPGAVAVRLHRQPQCPGNLGQGFRTEKEEAQPRDVAIDFLEAQHIAHDRGIGVVQCVP